MTQVCEGLRARRKERTLSAKKDALICIYILKLLLMGNKVVDAT